VCVTVATIKRVTRGGWRVKGEGIAKALPDSKGFEQNRHLGNFPSLSSSCREDVENWR
jgi:hypothetical protein